MGFDGVGDCSVFRSSAWVDLTLWRFVAFAGVGVQTETLRDAVLKAQERRQSRSVGKMDERELLLAELEEVRCISGIHLDSSGRYCRLYGVCADRWTGGMLITIRRTSDWSERNNSCSTIWRSVRR